MSYLGAHDNIFTKMGRVLVLQKHRRQYLVSNGSGEELGQVEVHVWDVDDQVVYLLENPQKPSLKLFFRKGIEVQIRE